MKKVVALAIMAVLVSGCASKTEFGECIGIMQEKKPDLVYEMSVRNVVMAVVFFETAVVPIVVIANQHSCPVGKK